VLGKTPLSEARFVTVGEVARIMRVSNMTVYRLIRTGRIAAVRVGKNYRIPEDDVHSYLESHYVAAG